MFQLWGSLLLPGSLAMGGQQAKLDADIRPSSSLGTPSIHTAHDYHPFALEDGYRLAPMGVKVIDRLEIL
jgi:hypothetical protein